MKSFKRIFDYRNLLHYLANAILLIFVSFPLTKVIGLMDLLQKGGVFNQIWAYFLAILFYAGTLFIFDTIIHALWKPLFKWKD